MMTERIVLDVHAHLVPVDTGELSRLAGVSWDEAKGLMTVDGHVVGLRSIYDPLALRAWMAKHDVHQAFVSVPPPLYRQQLRNEESRSWCDYLNEGLRRICADSEGTLTPLLHLPTENPALAAEIAARNIAAGHTLFAMPTGTGDERTLGDPALDDLWSVLDGAAAFVFFHPGECADGRLKSFYLTNLLGNPYETAVALSHLIFAGVLERYVDIIMCFAHGGGLLPMVAGRFERGFATSRPGIDTDRSPPSQLVGRVYVDCICHDEAAACHAEATFGASHVVFGSDWPFPMGLVDPAEQLSQLSPERRRSYLEVNPGQLLSRILKENEHG